jgi:deoxyribodipyrimidine photo-lyase
MNYFWFRRDLRLNDNAGLYHALRGGEPVQAVFVFDTEILEKLDDPRDRRVQFLHQNVSDLQKKLRALGADLVVRTGKPVEVWKKLLREHPARTLYANHDYEPASIRRDVAVEKLCASSGVAFQTFKDQVIFEKDEIVTEARKPYTVYTPYKKKWLASLSGFYLKVYPTEKYFKNFLKVAKSAAAKNAVPTLRDLKFAAPEFVFPPARVNEKILKAYAGTRDFPALEHGTSRLGLHLRFGTLSVRELARAGRKNSAVWLSELIWREFFMQVLWHFPQVEKRSFREHFEKVPWRKSPADFRRWCEGRTGYPLVDAGMRELNATGFMHNRVRMVTASFLSKHLLIHWSRGERYFAAKLLDYDLSANNGNWQWAAGTGCDAAPYFRVFNPETQARRFDGAEEYIRKWIPELGTAAYPEPMVDHVFARNRALSAYKAASVSKKGSQ